MKKFANNFRSNLVISTGKAKMAIILWAALMTTTAIAQPTLSGTTHCQGSVLTVNNAVQPIQVVWQQDGVSTSTVTATWAANATTVAGGNGSGNAANQFFHPEGLYIDGSGNIYVADYANMRIQKWAPGATTGVTVAGGNGPGSGADQIGVAYDVYLDAGGNVYALDEYNNRVQKWAPGATAGITVAGGNGPGSAANQLWNPNSIYVDGDGNIYISDPGNYRVQKWAPGAAEGVTVAGGNGPGGAANQLDIPNGLYVDVSGNVYVAEAFNYRVQKWAPGATEGITVAGGNGPGSAANQLYVPAGIYVDGAGNVYVSDQYNHRIQKWAPGATVGITVAGGNGAGSAANQLNHPYDVYLDSNGNMYVADEYNNRIQKFAASITNTLTATAAVGYSAIVTTGAGAITTNTITIDGPPVTSAGQNTAIYAGNSTMLTATGATTYTWSPSSGLSATTGASVTAAPAVTTVYTVTSTNACGSSMAEVTVAVYALPTLSSSTACTGSMITIASPSQPVQIIWRQGGINTSTVTPTWAANGVIVAGGNGRGGGANQLSTPADLFVDASGNIYVADVYNHRVQKWAPDATVGVTVAGGNGAGSDANQLFEPAGVYVDASGNVYVADQFNSRIQKWAPGATAGVTVAGGNGYGSGANQFSLPNGVYVDAGGNIYVTDGINNRVQKWAPGAAAGVTVAGGIGAGSAGNQLHSPMGLWVDDTGNMYIADNLNNRIQKWAPGATSGITVAGGNGAGSGANQLNQPVRVAVDGSGNIYVCDADNSRIQKWSPGAAAGVTVAGGNGAGSGANQLDIPIGLYVDGSRNIYVSQSGSIRISKFTASVAPTLTATTAGVYDAIVTTGAGTVTTNTITVADPPIVTTGRNTAIYTGHSAILNATGATMYTWSPSSGLSATTGASVTATPAVTTIYTVTATNACSSSMAEVTVAVYALPTLSSSTACTGSMLTIASEAQPTQIIWQHNAANDTVAASWAANGIIVAGGNGSGDHADQLERASGVFVDTKGNIYVADPYNYRVQKWTPGATEGVTVAGGNGAGSAANQLYFPEDVYVDGSGNMYIADFVNNRIQKWTPGATAGVTVAGGNGQGANADQLDGPNAIDMDEHGNIYVADVNNHRIQKWAPGAIAGVTVAGGNGQGPNADQLNVPTNVAVDADGNIYVADYNNFRVQKWIPGATAGVTVAGGHSYGSADNQCTPEGLYVDGSGNIYIADAGGRVQKWIPGATAGITVAGGHGSGTGADQIAAPKSVCLDDSGNIYVSDFINARVQKYAASITHTHTATTVSGYTAIVTTAAGTITTGTVAIDTIPATTLGNIPMCIAGQPVTLSNVTSPNGTWSSSNTLVAAVSSTGIVMPGTAAGTAVISYATGCGTAAVITASVNATPAAISGNAQLCVSGNALVVSDNNSPNGIWSSSNTAVATIDAATGVITPGLLQGLSIITYNNACGSAVTTASVNAAPSPVAGNTWLCAGGAALSLTNDAANGTWSSSNTSVATVNALSGQVVSGIQGITFITYANACGPAAAITATVNAMPAAITGSTPLCATGAAATLFNTATNGTWSSSDPALASVSATGIVQTATGNTTGGTVTITYSNGCAPAATTTFTVNALPVIQTFTGGGGYCAGDNGVHIGLTLSQPGISYQLYRTPGIAIGTPVAGYGPAINFGTWHTVPGVYYVIATHTTTGCTNYLPGVTVYINPLPDTFTVTGGGSYCAGDAGVPVGLSGSVSGVSYQLYNSGLPSGAALTGTGSPIDFGTQSLAGHYTVTGTTTATHCSSVMGVATAAISILSLPGTFTVTGSSSFCSLDSGVHIGLNNAAPGIVYQLYRDGYPAGTGVTGSGIALDFGLYDTAGIYTVRATDLLTHCMVTMDNADTLTVDPLPAAYHVTGGGSYCAGGAGLHIGTDNSAAGIRYWSYPVTSGTGTSLNGTGGPLDFGLFTTAGTYSVVAIDTTTGCSSALHDSAVINIAPAVIPTVSLSTGLTTGNVVCLGNPVTFTAHTHYGGADPVYEWQVNNIGISITDSEYTYIPVNGDVVTVKMISNEQCALSDTALSMATINTDTPAAPSVSIAVSPINMVAPGTIVTMTATPTNGGPSPTYQWYKNGVILTGQTSSVYSGVFLNHDSISVEMVSSGGCGGLASHNSVVITVYPEGIEPVHPDISDIRLIPNPNKGAFTITGSFGTTSNEEVLIAVTDMLGQIVYHSKVLLSNGAINIRIQLTPSLANGMYLLNLQSSTDQKVFHFVIEQ